jgi:hypothetical protein
MLQEKPAKGPVFFWALRFGEIRISLAAHAVGEALTVIPENDEDACFMPLGAAGQPPGHPNPPLKPLRMFTLGRPISARVRGRTADPLDADHPWVEDGGRGVWFIEKVVQSARSEQKWTSMN